MSENFQNDEADLSNLAFPVAPAGQGNSTSTSQELDFDLEELRLPQSFTEMAEVQKHVLHIPIKKPDRQEFIRIHPDPEFSLHMAVIEDKEEETS